MSQTEEHRSLKLLKAIHDLASVLYPYPEGAQVSPHLTFALGEIAGIASKAIQQAKDSSKE
jgi:hypothetical protein